MDYKITLAQNATDALPGDEVTSNSVIAKTNSAEGKTTFSYIDGYCERAGKPDVMAEPLNLFTNFAFLVAAILAFKLLKLKGMLVGKNWDIILLSTLLGVIGFGSAAFHSYPNVITVNMDVIPIALFIHIYLLAYFIRVVGVKPIFGVIILLAFVGVGILFGKYISPDTLNGTIMYVPTYLMLIVMILILGFVKQSPLFLHLINTAVVWTFSLMFRTIDMQVCGYSHQIGTHFMWHLLNAIVLYRMVVLLILDKESKQAQA